MHRKRSAEKRSDLPRCALRLGPRAAEAEAAEGSATTKRHRCKTTRNVKCEAMKQCVFRSSELSELVFHLVFCPFSIFLPFSLQAFQLLFLLFTHSACAKCIPFHRDDIDPNAALIPIAHSATSSASQSISIVIVKAVDCKERITVRPATGKGQEALHEHMNN